MLQICVHFYNVYSLFLDLLVTKFKLMVAASEDMLWLRNSDRCSRSYAFVLNSVYAR